MNLPRVCADSGGFPSCLRRVLEKQLNYILSGDIGLGRRTTTTVESLLHGSRSWLLSCDAMTDVVILQMLTSLG